MYMPTLLCAGWTEVSHWHRSQEISTADRADPAWTKLGQPGRYPSFHGFPAQTGRVREHWPGITAWLCTLLTLGQVDKLCPSSISQPGSSQTPLIRALPPTPNATVFTRTLGLLYLLSICCGLLNIPSYIHLLIPVFQCPFVILQQNSLL